MPCSSSRGDTTIHTATAPAAIMVWRWIGMKGRQVEAGSVRCRPIRGLQETTLDGQTAE